MDDKTKEKRLEEIRTGIQETAIRGEDGREGVMLSYTLSNGDQVGVRMMGEPTDWFIELGKGKVAHSVLYREEMLGGGAK